MGAKDEPMSDERLAELQKRVAHRAWAADALGMIHDVVGEELLAEVERLRAQLAQMECMEDNANGR